MCMLFCYINPHPEVGQYRLVVVSNRDEMYDRPAKPAHFWECGILAGMDMHPGREGGTWLGMGQDGRIGCLLNVPNPAEEPLNKLEHRGQVVVNYLRSKLESLEYAKSIEESGVVYNNFNLVTLDPAGDSYKIFFYSQKEKTIKQLESGIHGFGNCSFDKPFLKVGRGCKKMEQIIETHGRVEKEEELTEALQAMMRDEEESIPDPQIVNLGISHNEQFLKALSNIYVCSSSYGTRTTTWILVDHSGKVKVQEKTMREPINVRRPEWDINRFSFQMMNDN